MGKNIRLNESQFNELITETVNRIITEMDWRTAVNAANKSRADFRDMVTRRAMEKLDPYGSYGNLTGQYGMPADKIAKKSWNSPKGPVRWVNKDDEIQRKMKQAVNLSKFADSAIKNRFGDESYYNNMNGVGKEFPHFRKTRKNREFGGYETLDYYPNEDYMSGEFDDYELTDMPQKYQDTAKEINDFQNGKSKYIEGQGWQ